MIKVTAPVRIDISAGWSDADPFRKDFGGAVLNAAINFRVSATLKNKELVSSLEQVPSSSGLGTSGALRSVYLVAANPSLIEKKIELIKRVHVFENAIVGQRAGFQDQATAIFGGVNYWEFKTDDSIKKIPISRLIAEHFYDRVVLIFTGDTHVSANIHEKVFGNHHFIKRIPQIERMKKIAKEMSKKLSNENTMKELINETWSLQKSLHPLMETDMMRKLQKIADGEYLAARATGAGGGGCMIFYTNKKKKLSKIFERARKHIPKIKVIPFEFDYSGIRIEG